MNQAQKIVDTHLLKTFFCIDLIEQGIRSVTLQLTSNGIADGQLGTLGCIFDYAARIVGYKTLGQCFISECEISVHNESPLSNLIVSASITATNKQYATYQCEIYSVNQSSNLLLAESQGTLQKSTVQKVTIQKVTLQKSTIQKSTLQKTLLKKANSTLTLVV